MCNHKNSLFVIIFILGDVFNMLGKCVGQIKTQQFSDVADFIKQKRKKINGF